MRTQRAEGIPNTNTDKRTPGAKASKASSRKMPQCIGDYEQWKERCHQRHVPSQRSHFSVPLSKHECTLLFAAHVATVQRSNVPCYVIHPFLGTIWPFSSVGWLRCVGTLLARSTCRPLRTLPSEVESAAGSEGRLRLLQERRLCFADVVTPQLRCARES